MRRLFFLPVLVLAAVACTEDDRDDVRESVDRNEPNVDCRARCSDTRDACVTGCTDDGCETACTDEYRDCEVDCD
jgi:hypothetical protein